MKRAHVAAVAVLLAACTPGGVAPAGNAAGPAAFTVDVNLSLHQNGYAPPALTVPVGSTIRFTNSDSFAHTATVLHGASSYPAGSPFTAAAQSQSGNTVSSNWSTGTLAAGASSQTLRIDAAGTYLYACFYHYGAPMRGMIVAQ